MSSIQKQLSLLFDKRKQSLIVDYLTYQRIRTQVFNYPRKYQNGDRFGNELGGKKHKKINETQRKIIHLLNDLGIDRISMAGIMGTLEQENLNENTFLNFI